LGVSEDALPPNGGLEAAEVEVAPPNTELDAAAVPPPKTDEPEAVEAVEAAAPKTDFEAGAELPKTDELLAAAVVLVLVGAVPEGLAPPKAELTAAAEPPKTEAPVPEKITHWIKIKMRFSYRSVNLESKFYSFHLKQNIIENIFLYF
jgi:hypothetical protein